MFLTGSQMTLPGKTYRVEMKQQLLVLTLTLRKKLNGWGRHMVLREDSYLMVQPIFCHCL